MDLEVLQKFSLKWLEPGKLRETPACGEDLAAPTAWQK